MHTRHGTVSPQPLTFRSFVFKNVEEKHEDIQKYKNLDNSREIIKIIESSFYQSWIFIITISKANSHNI